MGFTVSGIFFSFFFGGFVCLFVHLFVWGFFGGGRGIERDKDNTSSELFCVSTQGGIPAIFSEGNA